MSEQIKEEDWKPGLPETFEIEYANNLEIKDAIPKFGFRYKRGGSEEDGKVFFEGERDDGTTIKIVIEKGENYKSPAELEKEETEEK